MPYIFKAKIEESHVCKLPNLYKLDSGLQDKDIGPGSSWICPDCLTVWVVPDTVGYSIWKNPSKRQYQDIQSRWIKERMVEECPETFDLTGSKRKTVEECQTASI